MRLPMPSASATTAATVTAGGRSPGLRGLRLARASSFFFSARDGGFSVVAVAVGALGVGRWGLAFAGVALARRLRLRRPNVGLLGESFAQRVRRGTRIL